MGYNIYFTRMPKIREGASDNDSNTSQGISRKEKKNHDDDLVTHNN
jgi:hypothetical protein